jgi:alcohol dehydrogenase class IV
MCLASLSGGLALANAGLGAVHGFAGPIGGMFPAPHGAICAVLLPHVMESNLRAARRSESASDTVRRYDDIAHILTGVPEAKGEAGIDWLRELVGEFRIPGLASYGLTRDHTPELVEKASRANSMRANPVPLSREELASTLERAL